MKKLLIITQEQFGYQIDYYQYVTYLKNDFHIQFICWDYGRPKIAEQNVKVTYVSRDGNIVGRNFRFIKAVNDIIKRENFEIIFSYYFRGISLLCIACASQLKKFHLDVRTVSVSQSRLSRFIYDLGLRIESKMFRSKSAISPGVRDSLNLGSDCYILPLGADIRTVRRLPNRPLTLLYVGTLANRNIQDTLHGLAQFATKNPNSNVHYIIVGATSEEMKALATQARSLGISHLITIEGYVTHSELTQYYEKAHIGVSYVPMTAYFDHQPPTKTYEYLFAGMPVIATSTTEHRKIIVQKNGVLINDNPGSFAEGLQQLIDRIPTYDEDEIRQTVAGHDWQSIVNKMKTQLLSRFPL